MNLYPLPLVALLGMLLSPAPLLAEKDYEKGQEEESAVIREARKLLAEDRIDDAQKLLTSRLETEAGDRSARVFAAQVHAYNGQVDKAIAMLKGGLKDAPADTELLWYLAQMYMQLGMDGPGTTRIGRTVSYKPVSMDKEKEKEKEWRQEQWGAAVHVWRQFLKHDPENENASLLAVKSLAAWKGEGHVAEIDKLKEKFPGNPVIALSYAGALVSVGRAQDALGIAQEQIKARPRSKEAWERRSKRCGR